MAQSEPTRLFGTDGIRGLAGEYPLDPATVRLIGRSLASNIQRARGRAARIIIGRDTRESGPVIETALAEGALAEGAHVESAGVITTPGVAYLTATALFDAGVVISASHNPYRDNGIKVFEPTGRKLSDEMERAIERDLAQDSDLRTLAVETAPPGGRQVDDRATESRLKYLEYLLDEVAGDLSLDGFSIGLDCANGSAYGFAPDLFLRLGAYIQVIGAEPDGRNINLECGSLHLGGLQQLVKGGGLKLGIAFDGDADRVLFVDRRGEIVDGDATLLILADYLRSMGKLAGDVVVATVMSNIGLEIALRERSISLVRAQVGDRYVLDEMVAKGARLGGEQSGHIIFSDISLAGDGIITALQVLKALAASDRPLHELAGQMKRYPQVLINVLVRSKPPLDEIPAIRDEARKLETELKGRGRLLLRYSGTENLARVMIEGEDQESINRQARRMAEVISSEIGKTE
jgi:phosphoglucosamine mutase